MMCCPSYGDQTNIHKLYQCPHPASASPRRVAVSGGELLGLPDVLCTVMAQLRDERWGWQDNLVAWLSDTIDLVVCQFVLSSARERTS